MLGVPMAVLWLIFTRQFTIPALIVGYIFGVMVVVLLRVNSGFEDEEQPVRLRKIPSQIFWTIRYSLKLMLEIYLASFEVARLTLAPRINIQPAIYHIPTQDRTSNPVVSALSAHGITITPGTLVIDYEVVDGETIMIVHSLDSATWDEQSQIDGQTDRLYDLKRIIGDE